MIMISSRKIFCAIWISLALPAGSAHAGNRTSADYSVAADTIDSGGGKSASANYSVDASLGGAAGISTVASPAETAKHGYIGQLFDISSLALTTGNTNVNEGANRQLAALATLDDATLLTPDGGEVAWKILSGPIADINVSGRATATNVFQDTLANVSGSFLGKSATLNLLVLNTGIDDFLGYAGDGMEDSWQVQYFGINNTNATASADPDADGQNNAFEFVTGTVPTSKASSFQFAISQVPGAPSQKLIVFSPRFTNRTYTVESRVNFDSGNFLPLLTSTFNDIGATREVTDTNAVQLKKFYRVKVSFP